METTERIVEAYVRYLKGWATIPNIRCDGQYEIDLLAINPVNSKRYHIESGVSITAGFSKLTCKPFSVSALKQRQQTASQRRTLGYFVERKFGPPEILAALAKYGFREGSYRKIIVSWGWTPEAQEQAAAEGIELWDFRHLIREISEAFKNQKCYFSDDILRTLHLFAHAVATKES